ncbi:hypothetical protein [Endozoicomonas ascidiicola]|uniref:hypothetical protein n=1 Tax=Endozoicomonas ascidiicola TaxID=1698521 RepID=UPI000831C75B|nr:hypothetical protein [Endozoicomonas ascidiicola]
MEKPLQTWMLCQASYYIEYMQPKKSIALLEALESMTPEDPDVYRMLSYAYLQADQPEDSLRAADNFLRYTPPGSDVRAINWIKGRALLKKRKSAVSN